MSGLRLSRAGLAVCCVVVGVWEATMLRRSPNFLSTIPYSQCPVIALPSMAQETERPTDPEKGNTTQDVTKGIITIACQSFVDSPMRNIR
jgi:hypothetical protein